MSADLIHDIERVTIAPDEVLVVRPRGVMSPADNERLHRQVRSLAQTFGWDADRIVILDRDIELTIVKAEQLEMTG